MKRDLIVFILAAIAVFVIDQIIKSIFVSGFDWQSSCISLELHYNRGVAFSMFSFLGDWLKWIQVGLVGLLIFFIFKEGYLKLYAAAAGLAIGAACSNLADRFVHGGVVDYVAWHCGFDFAIFNFADVMIDVAVAWFLIHQIWFAKPLH